jgi:hypothetical protein
MTNNSRYQISSRGEGPNMLPKFGKASRWGNFVETMKTRIARMLQDENETMNSPSTLANDKQKSPGVRISRFSAISGSMSVSAFNSQLG